MESVFPDKLRRNRFASFPDHGQELLTRLRNWLLASLLLTVSLAFGQTPATLPQLFAYQLRDAATELQTGLRISLNTEVLTRCAPGHAAEFRTPRGSSYVFVTDTLTTSKTGTSHWVAHLQGAGTDYRAIISYGNGIAFGNISTPDGDFRLDTQGGQI